MVKGNISQEFGLEIIDETENYFIEEINPKLNDEEELYWTILSNIKLYRTLCNNLIN